MRVLTTATDEWSYALERVRLSGHQLPITLDHETVASIADWARTSKANADRAERWSVQVAEVMKQWLGSDDAEIGHLLDLLREVDDISDYWDLEY